jgi:fluoroquinolone transport system permease protein
MLKFMKHDMMLLAAGSAPVLAGFAIRFLIPIMEKALCHYTGRSHIMVPYYGLFDIFYSALTPVIFCFIAAMIMLEERDDHIDRYLFVTGLRQRGYYISHVIFPALAAFAMTLILLPIFKLTALSAGNVIFLAMTGTLQGIIVSLLIVTVSSNKLEGMAVTKLSSLIMFGALVPYFVPASLGYYLSFLPSFWTGMAIADNKPIYMLPAGMVSLIWIVILSFKYVCK